jgi:hypothetical protein
MEQANFFLGLGCELGLSSVPEGYPKKIFFCQFLSKIEPGQASKSLRPVPSLNLKLSIFFSCPLYGDCTNQHDK